MRHQTLAVQRDKLHCTLFPPTALHKLRDIFSDIFSLFTDPEVHHNVNSLCLYHSLQEIHNTACILIAPQSPSHINQSTVKLFQIHDIHIYCISMHLHRTHTHCQLWTVNTKLYICMMRQTRKSTYLDGCTQPGGNESTWTNKLESNTRRTQVDAEETGLLQYCRVSIQYVVHCGQSRWDNATMLVPSYVCMAGNGWWKLWALGITHRRAASLTNQPDSGEVRLLKPATNCAPTSHISPNT